MRPAITGDAKALREALEAFGEKLGDVTDHFGVTHLARIAAAAIDLPEPTAKAEEEPDYTCPKCGEWIGGPDACECNRKEISAAANRRIKELERERDEARHAAEEAERKRDLPMEWDTIYFPAYAKGAEDFRESVAKELEEHNSLQRVKSWIDPTAFCIKTVRSHPIPKPKEEMP